MSRKFLLTHRPEKELIKIQVDKALLTDIAELKQSIDRIDKTLSFDIDAICEVALRKALKQGKAECEQLMDKVPVSSAS